VALLSAMPTPWWTLHALAIFPARQNVHFARIPDNLDTPDCAGWRLLERDQILRNDCLSSEQRQSELVRVRTAQVSNR
jgi:hypothetical protein